MTTVRFGEEWTCSKELSERYAKYEKSAMPLLKYKARRISTAIPGIDYDDALQEGRLAVLYALNAYDPEKSRTGDPKPFVNSVVTNTYRAMVYEALMQTKVPHVVLTDGDGNTVKSPRFPVSLDAMLSSEDDNGHSRKYEPVDDSIGQDVECDAASLRSEVGRFSMRMYNKLGGKEFKDVDLQVFKCMVNPPEPFLRKLYMDGCDFVYRDGDGRLILEGGFQITNKQIRNYLGITKEKIDWSLFKIRNLFMRLAKFEAEFSDVFDGLLVGKRWPMIHQSDNKQFEDMEFLRKTFQRRGLSTKQIGDTSVDSNGQYTRIIRHYEWGVTLVACNGEEYATFVIEGRFNQDTSSVYGSTGANLYLPLSWYRKMAKELKNV
jgi:hypothetical protein